MKLLQIIEENTRYPRLPAGLLSKQEMISRGADGHLSRAFERYIKIDKIDGLEPTPSETDDGIGYAQDRIITQPIEVSYDANDDKYYLYAGNHRVTQALQNGETYIRAFVEPDRGKIGDAVTFM